MISKDEWTSFKASQTEILETVKILVGKTSMKAPASYITAKEFMEAVRIKRTKFDQLVQSNKIKTIKKKRKIYVPAKEVERYFSDPLIQ